MNRTQKLEELYAQLPKMKNCQMKCSFSCGPILMSQFELERVERAAGYKVPQVNSKTANCPLLTADGLCSVYSVRPLICRIWGTSEGMQCPLGCEPEFWLRKEEVNAFLSVAMAIGGKSVGPGADMVDRIVAETDRRMRKLMGL